MPTMTLRWKHAAFCLFCYAAFALYFGADVRGQKEDGKAREVAKAGDKDGKEKGKDGGKKQLDVVYYGVSLCANKGCHGGSPPDPEGWVTDKDGKTLGLLCRCIEAEIWKTNDKHADAYNVLKKERGQQMAKILGYDVTDPKGKGKACLACHAVVLDDKTLAASKPYRFNITEGVNCVVCHGPHVEWVTAHGVFAGAVKFRPLSRKVKEDEYGMRNLWDPVRRTELCSSCHVGKVGSNKITEPTRFVTHEMYAAGHPPLPGFEVATFSDEMPRHWQYLREKTPAIQKELGLRPGEEEQTQMVLVGAAIALRDTMRLIANQAKEIKGTRDEHVLDLANFDCYACHHDLMSSSWRQRRGYKGRPGRVPMRAWSTELVKLSIRHLANLDKDADDKELLKQLDTGMKKIAAAFDARPYGDPEKIETAAGELAGWADKLAQRMNVVYPNRKAALSLLATIPPTYGKELVDYDSARQIAWAYEIMFGEVNWKKKENAATRAILVDLDKVLKLRLPRGRKKLIEDELKDNLEKINNYDPEYFRKLLLRLGNKKRSGK